MHSTEEYEALEQSQHVLSVEEFALLLALLGAVTQEISTNVSTFYNTYGTDGVVTYITSRKRISNRDKRRRVHKLFLDIDKIFETYRLKGKTQFKKSLKKMIKTETDFYKVDLDQDDLLKTKWGSDNLSWDTRFDNQLDQQNFRIKNRLKVAFIKEAVVDAVYDVLEDEFEKFGKQLWSLYETEANAITSEARMKALKEHGFRKYRYYARADERTCDTCGAMHGTKFPISSFQIGVTAPPMHPHCRCWITELDD